MYNEKYKIKINGSKCKKSKTLLYLKSKILVNQLFAL